jgi:hypothetical protein
MEEVDKTLPTVIILHADICWENDFIHYDLFPRFPILNVSTCMYDKYAQDAKGFEEFLIENKIRNGYCVLIFSSNKASVWTLIDLCKLLRPLITLHLSDEWGLDYSPGYKEAYNIELSKYTKLLLRNYHHLEHNLSQFKNIECIPLGYTNGMITQSSVSLDMPKGPYERFYKWSFIGNVNVYRHELIDVFKNSNFGNSVVKNNATKVDLYETYKNTTFVPIGRGNKVLDCFRIYEAIISGAIPVIVGEPEEINNCFLFENNPPWVFAKTWKLALEECERLYDSPDELIQKQITIIDHWHNRVHEIREKILNVIYTIEDL